MQIFDEKTLKKRVGKLITDKRKSLKLSQEALAEILDIHVRTVGKIESGRSFLSADNLCKLSKLFNMPVKAFFEVEDSHTVSERNLNAIIDLLKTGGDEKINYYHDVIMAIEKKFEK